MSSTSSPDLPAPERAYRHLKDRILSAELAGGEMTSEVGIAAELGISRTPVREALLRLQAEGLVRVYPKRGVMVVPIAPGEAEDVFDARQLVESHAVLRLTSAAQGPIGAQALARVLSRLEELIAAQEDAIARGDLDAYAGLDTDFHLAVIDAGGNDLLAGFARGLRDRQQRLTSRGVSSSAERAAGFAQGHRTLLELLRAQDADGYGRELATHLDAVRGGVA